MKSAFLVLALVFSVSMSFAKESMKAECSAANHGNDKSRLIASKLKVQSSAVKTSKK